MNDDWDGVFGPPIPGIGNGRSRDYREGYRRGIEDAAKLAEETAKEVGGKFWETHRLNTGLLSFITKIRALAQTANGKKPR